MSIFDFLSKLSYKDVIMYDNLGYPIGLFSIKDDREIKMIIDYIVMKNMYLDVLVSTNKLKDLYDSELKAVQKILEKDK